MDGFRPGVLQPSPQVCGKGLCSHTVLRSCLLPLLSPHPSLPACPFKCHLQGHPQPSRLRPQWGALTTSTPRGPPSALSGQLEEGGPEHLAKASLSYPHLPRCDSRGLTECPRPGSGGVTCAHGAAEAPESGQQALGRGVKMACPDPHLQCSCWPPCYAGSPACGKGTPGQARPRQPAQKCPRTGGQCERLCPFRKPKDGSCLGTTGHTGSPLSALT